MILHPVYGFPETRPLFIVYSSLPSCHPQSPFLLVVYGFLGETRTFYVPICVLNMLVTRSLDLCMY